MLLGIINYWKKIKILSLRWTSSLDWLSKPRTDKNWSIVQTDSHRDTHSPCSNLQLHIRVQIKVCVIVTVKSMTTFIWHQLNCHLNCVLVSLKHTHYIAFFSLKSLCSVMPLHTYIAIRTHQHIPGAKSQTGETQVQPSSVLKIPRLWLMKAEFELHVACRTIKELESVINPSKNPLFAKILPYRRAAVMMR